MQIICCGDPLIRKNRKTKKKKYQCTLCSLFCHLISSKKALTVLVHCKLLQTLPRLNWYVIRTNCLFIFQLLHRCSDFFLSNFFHVLNIFSTYSSLLFYLLFKNSLKYSVHRLRIFSFFVDIRYCPNLFHFFSNWIPLHSRNERSTNYVELRVGIYEHEAIHI